jgi:hypothetical protein
MTEQSRQRRTHQDHHARIWKHGKQVGRRPLRVAGDGLLHPPLDFAVDGVYTYQISYGLASGQVRYCSQGTLLP